MGGGGGRRGQHERLAPTRKVWQLEKEMAVWWPPGENGLKDVVKF